MKTTSRLKTSRQTQAKPQSLANSCNFFHINSSTLLFYIMSAEKVQKNVATTEETEAAVAEVINTSLISISSFLKQLKGKRVLVKSHSGICYKGRLESIDGFMNISLTDAIEYYENEVNGILNEYKNEIFVRGYGIMHMSEL